LKQFEGIMSEPDIKLDYNYDEFTAEKVFPWLNFEASPPLGQQAPDFPLWGLNGETTRLGEIWSAHTLTIIEFGSFT
jgi:hypothetical protein